MKRRRIANTDLQVSALAFGTGSLHHMFSERDREAIVSMAYDHGFTHFDTAPSYGGGAGEISLRALAGKDRASFSVATKVGLYSPAEYTGSVGLWIRKCLGRFNPRCSRAVADWSVERATRSLEASLRRTQLDYFDVVFLHEPEPSLDSMRGMAEWALKQQRRGLFRYWGLAGQDSELSWWLQSDLFRPEVLQTRDNIETHPAKFVRDFGYSPQFTYGYMKAGARQLSVDQLISRALVVNATGAIIVSTRSRQHLSDLARIANAETSATTSTL